jgi:type I restriction enzyme M protein
LELSDSEAKQKQIVKELDASLDNLVLSKYPKLTQDEIKTLVIEDKWMALLSSAVQLELVRVSQTLTNRINQLAERYAKTLPHIVDEIKTLSELVDNHLRKMGAM